MCSYEIVRKKSRLHVVLMLQSTHVRGTIRIQESSCAFTYTHVHRVCALSMRSPGQRYVKEGKCKERWIAFYALFIPQQQATMKVRERERSHRKRNIYRERRLQSDRPGSGQAAVKSDHQNIFFFLAKTGLDLRFRKLNFIAILAFSTCGLVARVYAENVFLCDQIMLKVQNFLNI